MPDEAGHLGESEGSEEFVQAVPRRVPRTVSARRGFAPALDRLHELRGDPRSGAVLLVVVAVAAGLVWYRIGLGSAPSASGRNAGAAGSRVTTSSTTGSRGSASRSPSTTAGTTATTSTAGAAGEVVVHVSGAVVLEGLVRVPPGSRVADAVAAAGGAKPGADLRRLNLAAKLVDGQQVAVPMVGEPIVAAAQPGGDTPASAGAPLDLNTATQAQLEALPGIGPSLASAILAERARAGPFRSVDDLRKVRGIGDARFAQLQPLVRV